MNSQPDSTARAAWILLLLVFGLSCVPAVGFVVWVIAGAVLLVTFFLSLVVMANGRLGAGIALLVATLLVMPVAYLVAPVVSTALVGGAIRAYRLAQARPVPTGPEAEAAKARAVSLYPDLAIAGSPANTQFLAAVADTRLNHPAIFDHPDWPTVIAAKTLGTPIGAKAPRGSWMWKPGRTMLDRKPRTQTPSYPVKERDTYHYERSPISGNYVPVRDGSSYMRSVGGGG